MAGSGIVIVDDEEQDIDLVLETLVGIASRRMCVDYVSSSQEIVSEMKEKSTRSMKSKDSSKVQYVPYSALITDFNMDGLNGKQLIQIVTGRLYGIDKSVVKNVRNFNDVPDESVKQYLQDNFKNPAEYEFFRRRHEKLVIILHSSHSYGDGVNDIPEDIDFVHKNSNNACEQIVDILHYKNVLTDRDLKIFKNETEPHHSDYDIDSLFL